MSFITSRPILTETFFAAKLPPDCGAMATFFGVVRDHHADRAVIRLHYDCYPAMAEKRIHLIRDDIRERWQLRDLRILHRVGTLEIGEIALAVAATSAHRAEAFAACEETVERIKSEVPVWKNEFYADGTSLWVSCSHAGIVS